MNDQIGIGWRPELAAGILAHLEEIDIIEVIADDYFDASGRDIRALNTLARQVPIMLHGVTLGMASTHPVDRRRLERTARLLERVPNFLWSEHLAFVRAGEIEIGHLAFPPRCSETIEGTGENLRIARQIVGIVPCMENVSTLIDPPGSTYSEAEWLARVLASTEGDLLLDVQNIYANGLNFGYDPHDVIDALPPDRFPVIHISGGRMILVDEETGEHRLLDDHLHDVPDPVYELLEYAAAKSVRPLSVILERDGSYPQMDELLSQLRKAREAVSRGRRKRTKREEARAA